MWNNSRGGSRIFKGGQKIISAHNEREVPYRWVQGSGVLDALS